MNPLLTKLGVPMEVQAFFNAGDLIFHYGEQFEHFGEGFHRLPTTTNIWLAGNKMAREIIITSSAMEAIAFLTIHSHRYPDLKRLSFLALGNLPQPVQCNWIRAKLAGRKFTLVFSNDLLGRLADIRVGAALKQKRTSFLLTGGSIRIKCDNECYELEQERLSMSAFEKISGLRMGMRTHKPKQFNTFLEQLKYDSST
ncbi:MAG: hypothetical protein JWP37_2036 [Mucilaginibacter sp.]|nr:hypothetical protein [Mucilaginibacter sp.]